VFFMMRALGCHRLKNVLRSRSGSISVSGTTEESVLMKLHPKISISHGWKRSKNTLRSNRKLILMYSENVWTVGLNALKIRTIAQKNNIYYVQYCMITLPKPRAYKIAFYFQFTFVDQHKMTISLCRHNMWNVLNIKL
jgi:hypothetical protein